MCDDKTLIIPKIFREKLTQSFRKHNWLTQAHLELSTKLCKNAFTPSLFGIRAASGGNRKRYKQSVDFGGQIRHIILLCKYACAPSWPSITRKGLSPASHNVVLFNGMPHGGRREPGTNTLRSMTKKTSL